MARRTDYSKRF